MIDCLQIISKGEDSVFLNEFISRIPTLNQVSTSDNLMDAYSSLLKQKPSLIFFDLDLSDKANGCEFIRNLPFSPSVVFISSKAEDALDAFEIGALDFLQKPLLSGRLFKTINRIMSHYQEKVTSLPAIPEKQTPDNYLFMKMDNRIIRINPDDILFISAQSDYIKIHLLNQRPLMLLESLKNMEARLSATRFIRVHRSYIVSIDKINCIQKKRIQIGDERIPISDSYYAPFLQRIEQCQLSV